MQRAPELAAPGLQPGLPAFEELSWLRAERLAADTRQRQLLSAMTAFRDGDFSVRLPADWAGVDGRIAEAFNQAIVHKERLRDEVDRLTATVGREGRLRQRMSLPGAMSDGNTGKMWRREIKDTSMLTRVMAPPTSGRSPGAR